MMDNTRPKFIVQPFHLLAFRRCIPNHLHDLLAFSQRE
jgi:hypothetical protein